MNNIEEELTKEELAIICRGIELYINYYHLNPHSREGEKVYKLENKMRKIREKK